MHYTATIKPLDSNTCGAFSVRIAATGLGRAKVEAEAVADAALAARAAAGLHRGFAVVILCARDEDGDVTDRYRHTTERGGHGPRWRSIGAHNAPPAPCKRCGGNGWESVMDTHCYACGRHGPRTRAWHAAQDKRASG